jgi:hypothetical protein
MNLNNPLPALPVFDMTTRVQRSESLASEVMSIVPETRFRVRYMCGHPRCGKVHEYIVTARRHDPDARQDGTGGGLWCDDVVDYATHERDDCPMCIGYNGAIHWHNRMVAILRHGPEKGMAMDPVEGDFKTPRKGCEA